MNLVFAILTLLSFALTIWQWLAARRFPLHWRVVDKSFTPAVTLLKPLKGCDDETENCLRSWLAQDYAGSMQFLFGVASADDAVCETVRKLIAEFPQRDAQLVVCVESLGANAKVSTLAQLEQRASYTVIVISDADVRVPADFLTNIVAPLQNETIGLVNCFYRLANPASLAMRWEAVAVNADFWSSVLQTRALAPLDFALGAAMAVRRQQLREIGGFAAIADCLADDYQLGHRIAQRGHHIELSPVVVECWSSPMTGRDVWRHQLRWARTIRVCRPVAYFFSILSNATLWPMLWLGCVPLDWFALPMLAMGIRVIAAENLNHRLTGKDFTAVDRLLVPAKDLLQFVIWLLAFTGNRIEWRGENYRLRRDGTLGRIG